MDKNWKDLVAIHNDCREDLIKTRSDLWFAKYAIKRIREHRTEYSHSRYLDWLHDFDIILSELDPKIEVDDPSRTSDESGDKNE